MFLEGFADAAVYAIGADDRIAIGETREILNGSLIMDRDSDILAALLQNSQQREARATRETVAAATHLTAFVTDNDIVPIGERAFDRGIGFRVAAKELLKRFVGEHH